MGSYVEHPGVVYRDWTIVRELSLAYLELGVGNDVEISDLIMRTEPFIPEEEHVCPS